MKNTNTMTTTTTTIKRRTLTKKLDGCSYMDEKSVYTLTDGAGNVIARRRTKRKYVACTSDGAHFFTIRDLEPKADFENLIYLTK